MIRAVAWDVDGTLVDSEPAHHAALIQVSALYGPIIAPDDARFVGVAMEDVWETLRPLYPADLQGEHWREQIVAAYVAGVASVAPCTGAREAVAALAKAGLRQGSVSNSARRVVEANLTRLGLEGVFEFAIAREDVTRGKPDPEPYALACRRFGLPPALVLAVEDSEAGAASARAAGLHVLRVDADGFAAVLAQCTPLATPWMK